MSDAARTVLLQALEKRFEDLCKLLSQGGLANRRELLDEAKQLTDAMLAIAEEKYSTLR